MSLFKKILAGQKIFWKSSVEKNPGIQETSGSPVDPEVKIFLSLRGKYRHYCPDWDFMAIDENCIEFDGCTCEFKSVVK